MRKKSIGNWGLVLLCAGLLLAATAAAQTNDAKSAAEAQAAQANDLAQLSTASSAQAVVNEKEASLPEAKPPDGPSDEELKLMEEFQGKEPPPAEEASAIMLPFVPDDGTTRAACVGDKDINGAGTTAWGYTLNVYYKNRRSTSLYLASEFGCSEGGPISGVRYYVSQVPVVEMPNLLIRMRHTATSAYSTACFDNTGWTTVWGPQNLTITTTGWYTFTFATPFMYDGVSNLEVDVSLGTIPTYNNSGTVWSFTASANRSLTAQSDTIVDPANWTCGTGMPTVTMRTGVPRMQFIFPPPNSGACCVDYVCVATNTNPECDALAGTWYGGQDCATFYCPPWNDNCTAVAPVALTPGVPVTFTGNNLGATNDCGSFAGGQVWHAVTLPAGESFFDVWLDYCTTDNGGFPFGNSWLNWATGCPCTGITTAGTYDTTTCGDGNITIKWSGLASGTYYYPVLLDAANHAAGNYTLHVVCMPAYCASNATSTADETLKNVTLGTINNTTTNCDLYDNFTDQSTDLIAGSTYSFSITIGDCEGTSCYTKWLKIYIDWNQDYDFTDAGEQAYTSGVALPNTPCPDFVVTGNVTVPASATVGCTRMRVIVRESSEPTSCGTYTWGATEDYTVCVLPPPPQGACCFGVDCTPDQYQSVCEAAGGRYKGDGSTCTPYNPCFGACCFQDGSCQETLDEAACAELGGNYHGDGTTCTPNLCPQPGNDCTNPMPIVLSAGSLPFVDADTTCGRLNDYADTCLGYYDGGEDMIYAVLVTDPMCVNIAVDGTLTYVGVAIDTNCPPGLTCLAFATSSAGDPIIPSVNLNAGIYYIMIDTWPSPTCSAFTMTISACPTPVACCFPDGSCQLLLPAACVTAGGISQGEGTNCDPNLCEPDYCPAGSSYVNCDEYISHVVIGTIDNATACSQPGGYGNYTALSTDLMYGLPVAITVTNGHPYSSDQCMVWIDWNQDKDFYDPGEAITMSGSPGNGPYTANITAPPEALAGPTRMRVRITYTGVLDPCGITTYGEVEDYTVNIMEAPGACCWNDGTCTSEVPSACGGFYGGPLTECAGVDCNNNGVDDFCDIAGGYEDCDGNGIPDECQPFEDCDGNGTADFCDLAQCDGSAWCSDCNDNGILDVCDIANCPEPIGMWCSDCQENGIPDGCEVGGARVTYQYDDGTSENGLGNGTYNHEICWIHHFTVASRTPISAIETSFGTPAYPGGSGVTAGAAFRVFVWSDPNGDGDPTDAVLLAQANGTAEAGSIDTDVLQSVPIDAQVSGSFFVGASIEGIGFQAPMDENGTLAHESWGAYTTTPPIDPTNFAAILFNADTAGFPCNWMLRAESLGSADCNLNGIPDVCDVPPICEGPDCSQDCNNDLVPDECQLEGNDCNGNLRPDDCDIASGSSPDCNTNGIPDECELETDDCNGNLVPDECDIANGDSQDCQPNGIPDECDIANCNHEPWCEDCQPDTIPDGCQLADRSRDVIVDEGFETSVPPSGWTLISTHTGTLTWYQGNYLPYAGLYDAECLYDPALVPQDEWLLTPVLTLFGDVTLTGATEGSVYWGITPYDNYDIQAWIVIGDVGGGDDTMIAELDTDNWVTNWTWATFSYTFPAPAGQFRIGFRYVGVDGAQGDIDAIQVLGQTGAPANDCNQNQIPDECDIGVQWGGYCTGPDCDSDWNSDGIPDGCELCGDIDGDEDVDFDDYWDFLDAFGTCVGNVKYNPAADMDGDGCITLVDYQAWRMCYKMANNHDFVAPKPKPMPVPVQKLSKPVIER